MSLNDDLVTYLSVIGDNTYPLPVTDDRAIHIRELVQQAKAMLGAGPPPAPIPAPTVMYDSVTAADIPADAAIVAGYVDGLYAWSGRPEVPSGDWARFPNAKRITISVNGGGVADFWDCETGDLNPGQAAVMVQTYPGTGVYCSLSLAPQVISAMHWAGMDGQYTLWIADWTGEPHIPSVSATINGTLITPTVVACQYANPDSSGGHYDLSLITAAFLATF